VHQHSLKTDCSHCHYQDFFTTTETVGGFSPLFTLTVTGHKTDEKSEMTLWGTYSTKKPHLIRELMKHVKGKNILQVYLPVKILKLVLPAPNARER
jgi:hypothetical protein